MADYIELDGVRTWYDEHGEGEPLVLLHGGFSDARDFGGNLATLADRFRLLLPERLVLISTAFDMDGLIFRPIAGGQMPPPVVARYAEVPPDGADHFQVVVDKIGRAVEEEPGLTPADLPKITARTLVLAGDDDLVTLPHTANLYQTLPDAELAILPATSHLLMFEKPELCIRLVADFRTADRAPTLMPIRRAPG